MPPYVARGECYSPFTSQGCDYNKGSGAFDWTGDWECSRCTEDGCNVLEPETGGGGDDDGRDDDDDKQHLAPLRFLYAIGGLLLVIAIIGVLAVGATKLVKSFKQPEVDEPEPRDTELSTAGGAEVA